VPQAFLKPNSMKALLMPIPAPGRHLRETWPLDARRTRQMFLRSRLGKNQ
jgi:hypothetical protein